MIRALAVMSAIAALAGHARADDSEPDEITDIESQEANLESNAPRKGITTAAALYGGIMLGGDIGVGRGPGVSIRIGHVATRKTVITFEVAGNSALHKPSMTQTLSDSNFGLFVGAQRYVFPSVWVRFSGGLNVFTKNAGSGSKGESFGGLGGLVGGGFDIARWGYLVLGVETFGMTSLTDDGLKLQLCFGVGLSYY